VYVLSKGRWNRPLTIRLLHRDRVPFRVVVEPQEVDDYANIVGRDNLLILPVGNQGQGSIPARNAAWADAIARGAGRHWVLDDNIQEVYRVYNGARVPFSFGPGMAISERFIDRYQNVGLAGPFYANYSGRHPKPFRLNTRIYSCLLIDNGLPVRWRGRYNEDTDLSLQVLALGLCTVLFEWWVIGKVATMTMRGGNSAELYQGDGRLRMARSLERVWPGVVETSRRFGRPQHRIPSWRQFDQPLIRRPDVESVSASGVDEHGIELVERQTPRSPRVRSLRDTYREQQHGRISRQAGAEADADRAETPPG